MYRRLRTILEGKLCPLQRIAAALTRSRSGLPTSQVAASVGLHSCRPMSHTSSLCRHTVTCRQIRAQQQGAQHPRRLPAAGSAAGYGSTILPVAFCNFTHRYITVPRFAPDHFVDFVHGSLSFAALWFLQICGVTHFLSSSSADSINKRILNMRNIMDSSQTDHRNTGIWHILKITYLSNKNYTTVFWRFTPLRFICHWQFFGQKWHFCQQFVVF